MNLVFARGDSQPFKTRIKIQNSTPISKDDVETLFITCKEDTSDYSPVIFQKTLEDVEIDEEGYLHIEFKPEDTERLYYQKYYFDIEITLKSGYRKTALHTFKLTGETTTHGGEKSGN